MKTKLKFPLLLCLIAIILVFRLTVLHIYSQYELRCYCEKCLSENDPWFQARFNKSVEPLMSGNYSLPESEFNWWKRVQGTKENFTVFNKQIEDMFKVIPRSPDVMKPDPKRCRTCAVVGNSVTLSRSGYGPIINSHDVVMRMNYAMTKGFEADVGNKTTHRIMYPESSTHLDNTTHLVMFPFKFKDLEWIEKALTTGYTKGFRSKIRANKNLVMVVNPAFMRYVHVSWLEKKGYYPSTGFMTVILALHICDEVRVFGFGADKEGNWNHYWSPNLFKKLKTGAHPGKFEYETIQKLHQQKIIQFFTGW